MKEVESESKREVLIVPCGMETEEVQKAAEEMRVLIVPCGMETGYAVVVYVLIQVLIVPCGMETVSDPGGIYG